MAGKVMAFTFIPSAPSQVSWEINLDANRNGTYRELKDGAEAQPVQVSEAIWKRLQGASRAVRSGRCETKLQGIAQTGKKTISVANGPALASCVFNYSDDDKLNDSAQAFLALASAVQFGAKLQRDLRFDKLALDADMDVFVGEVSAGRALEPGNIGTVLRAIAEDDHVIDRVRRKAARLLQDAPDKPR